MSLTWYRKMPISWKNDSTEGGYWAPFCDVLQNGNPLRIASRNNLLFAAGAIAVVAGFLFPLSSQVLDVLLIFSISLTVAFLIITLSAQSILEVSGFPLLILAATMLRIALSVAFAKLILSRGDAGTIVGFAADIIVLNNKTVNILIFGSLAAVTFGVICKAVRDIGRTASEFTADTALIKQMSVDNELNAGIISERQALARRAKIVRETRLFAAMSGVGRFMLCGAAIELITIVVNVVGGVAIGAIGETTTGIPVRIYASLAAGAGSITQLCAVITVVASRYLVQKSSVLAAGCDKPTEEKAVRRTNVVAGAAEREIVRLVRPGELAFPKATESQDDDILNCTETTEYLDAEFTEITNPPASGNVEADEAVGIEDIDALDDNNHLQAETNSIINSSDESITWQVCGDDDYYDAIVEFIQYNSAVSAKTILIAAESVEWLPVTVPVNIAIRLAQKGLKCLLIDLDSHRNAVSEVFGISTKVSQMPKGAFVPSSNKVQAKAITTCINNLWMCPASNIGQDTATNIKAITASSENQYDHIIIYGPNVSSLQSADKEEIAAGIQTAMLFGPGGQPESSFIGDFSRLLIGFGCDILKPGHILAESI